MATALITGASRGIGVGFARRFAAEGCSVAAVARTRAEGDVKLAGSLDTTVAAINDLGGTAKGYVADLTADDFDAVGLIESVEADLGPIRYLINNAAAAFYTPFAEISAKRIEISFRANVLAPWQLAQAVLPGMIERGEGSILNISSATSIVQSGPPFYVSPQTNGAAAYGGSKSWLERATVGGAAELGGTGVSLNTLAPDVAVASEGAVALVDLSGHLVEPLDTMAQAAWSIMNADPAQVTGQVAYSLSWLYQNDVPVYDLGGQTLLEGWQPADFPLEKLRMTTG